ncbi:MAG: hypothetical protein QM731_13595 [Chitinophagaceae bacterium]
MTLLLSLQSLQATTGNTGNSLQHPSADTLGYQTQALLLVKECPVIKDSAVFIAALKANCHLANGANEQVTAFKKISLAGSAANYFLVEYSHYDDDTTTTVSKCQLVFNSNGTLLRIFSALQYDLVKIQDKESPYLMLVTANEEGNGTHAFYKIENNKLVNVFKGFYEDCPRTYDACQNETVNEPFALNVSFTDVNKDGYKDIVFKGKIVLIQAVTKNGLWYDVKITKGQPQVTYSLDNPFRKIDVEYVFLFNKKDQRFEPMKDYSRYCTNNLALLLYRTLD